jgi:hypothetical protein
MKKKPQPKKAAAKAKQSKKENFPGRTSPKVEHKDL